MIRRKHLTTAMAAAIGAAISNAAVQSVNAQERTIEEVVVTAEKRTESLQYLSQAVTALTAKDLDYKNVNSFVDLSAVAPAVTVAKNEGFKTIVSIRGVGNEANQNATVNVPLGDNLAIRTSVGWVQQEGYTDNVYNGPIVTDPTKTIKGEDLDDINNFSFRTDWLYEPTDTLSLRFLAQYFEGESNGAGIKGIDDPTRGARKQYPDHLYPGV